MSDKSLIALNGIDFIEYASPEPESLKRLFALMGFAKTAVHREKPVHLFQQGECRFAVNEQRGGFAEDFSKSHGGPSVCSLGFRVDVPAKKALEMALARGAKAAESDPASHSFPAIYGVGGSLIYFVDDYREGANHWTKKFRFFGDSAKESPAAEAPREQAGGAGLLSIDHLTNNVETGKLQHWRDFYNEVFGFTERRYFDIQGAKTGLISKVMRSPCDTITIPINEPSPDERGKKSQIQEYLEEYKGAGIQHIALKTSGIIPSVEKLRGAGIQFLDVPGAYYEALKSRVPLIRENLDDLRRNRILADGDSEGYLLQIFTKNVIGPVFFEIIQRHNHHGFGEGNFQALFDAIERDQIKRGYLSE